MNTFKNILTKISLSAVLLLVGMQAQASHIASAHMFADYIAPNTYKITLELYRDCSGVNLSDPEYIDISSSCTGTQNNVPLPRDTFFVENGLLCANVLSNCNGGSVIGYEKHVYSDTITLPVACSDFTFNWISCCRNPAILNLQNPGGAFTCITLYMNTLDYPTNSSPRYLELPIPYVCVNNPYTYINGLYDPNSDSTISESMQPVGQNCNTLVPYSGTYSVNNPLPTTASGFYVDPNSGNAIFEPTQQGAWALAFRTVERDRITQNLMSYVERDVQLNVLYCNSPPPVLDSSINSTTGLWTNIDTISGGVVLKDSGEVVDIGMCPGDSLYIEVTGVSQSSSNMLTTEINNLQTLLPGAVYTALPGQNVSPITGQLIWQPTAADIGDHNGVVISFRDSTCDSAQPIILTKKITLNIKVYPGVDAGPDKDYCGNTSDTAVINATGPSNVNTWTWELLNGNTPTDLAPVNSANVKAWPSTTTTYVVKTDALTSCKNMDTVVVEVHPPIPAEAGADITICANQNYSPATNIGPNQSVLWTPNYNISDTSSATPTMYPGLSTTYVVEIVDNNNCTYHDSVKVTINGVAPSITAWAEKDTICPNEDAYLHVVANSQLCGLAQSECGGSVNLSTLTQGTTSSSNFYSPFNNKVKQARNQFILTKADLNSMGLTEPNYISSIGYTVLNKGTNTPLRKFHVRMACSAEQQYTTVDFNPNVYDEVLYRDSFYSVLGLNTLDFDVPYYWDGETSLMFDICYEGDFNNLNQGDNIEVLLGTANQWVYKIQNNTAPPLAPACEEIATSISNYRPKLTLGHCEDQGFNLSWSPTTFLDDPTSYDPIGENVTNDPMSWTVTATSNVNSNCSNSETITVYHDKSTLVTANISAPDYNNGAWNTDSVVLCEAPSIFNLRMDTVFTAPVFACDAMSTLCPNTYDFILDPANSVAPNGDFTPFNSSTRSRRSQFLVTTAELAGIGLDAGEIETLGWKVETKNSVIPYKNFSIKLGCTTADSLTTMLDNNSLVQVYSANEYDPTVGWNEIELQKHYGWDGTQNLVVELCYWNGISGPDQPITNFDVLEYSNVGFPVAHYRSDSIGSIEVCDHNPAGPYKSKVVTNRPNFKFGICQDQEPTFYWTPSTYINDTTLTSTFGIGVETRWYYANVTGRNGCFKQDSVKVVVPINDFEVSPLDTFICSTDRAFFDAGVGDKAVTYEWIPTDGVEDPTGEGTHIEIPYGGTFPYEVIWTDVYGCQDTGNVVLNVWDTPYVAVTPLVDTIAYGSSVTISSTGGEVFSWAPISSLDNPFNNIVIASPEDSTLYKVISIDSNGCKGTGYSMIYIDYTNPTFIPNAFTPDGDGTNDIFEITNQEYEKIQTFKVYDRWGEEVFDAVASGKDGWDGYIDGQLANEGVYIYLIRIIYRDGSVKNYKGDITLLR